MVTRDQVKQWFETGDKPTQAQFHAWLDSILFNGEVEMSDVAGLIAALLNKADLISGKVPASQLPSYVDDVLEFANFGAFPVGEAGKIYIAIDTGYTYRWSGSVYVQIGGGTGGAPLVMPNNQQVDYTLAASDHNKVVRMFEEFDLELTLPLNATVPIPVGTLVTVRNAGLIANVAVVNAVGVSTIPNDDIVLEPLQSIVLHKIDTDLWDAYAPPVEAAPGGDVTPPGIVSITALGANVIRLVATEDITATIAGWSFSNGSPLTIDGVAEVGDSGGTSWEFDIVETMASGQTITASYNSGTGNTVDNSNNELVSFSNVSVTNSIPGGGGGYDSDADNYFTLAGITETAEKDDYNALVVGRKADGTYTPSKVLYPFLGNTAAQQRKNAKTPASYEMTLPNGASHTTMGIGFSGTNQYGNTGFKASEIAFNSRALILGVQTAVTDVGADRWDCGAFNGSIGFGLQLSKTGGADSTAALGNLEAVGHLLNTPGVVIISITATGRRVYKDGVLRYESAAAPGEFDNDLDMFLGALNISGSPAHHSNARYSYFEIIEGLSPTAVGTVNTRVTTFLTARGRL